MMPTKSDSRRRLNATGYSNLDGTKAAEGTTEPDGFVNEQWSTPNVDEITPWKTIAIILTLFIGGSTCICCAALDWLAIKENQDRSDRIWALIIIGALTLIPGGYYFYVLSCIMMRRRGYTMDDIRRLG